MTLEEQTLAARSAWFRNSLRHEMREHRAHARRIRKRHGPTSIVAADAERLGVLQDRCAAMFERELAALEAEQASAKGDPTP